MSVSKDFDLSGRTAPGRAFRGYISAGNTEALHYDPVRSEQILAPIPAGRWGDPEDFKGPVVFLASAASRYVHGMTWPVDGGWTGRWAMTQSERKWLWLQ